MMSRIDQLTMEMIERAMYPIMVLDTGYCIPDCRPGSVITWRPLGIKSRPLQVLSAFEQGLAA